MMLLAFMYHRAGLCGHGNTPQLLDDHFAYVASRCVNVLPGEPLRDDAINLCLTFDDAYFDFYDVVYPLLRKHGLRALLGVPVFVVRDRVDSSRSERRRLPLDQSFLYPRRGGFCTWPELEEMSASGHVAVAAHGFTHSRLDDPGANLSIEIDVPQTILASRLATPVTSFVFPYGRFSAAALRRVRSRYDYSFRIGGAMNSGWDASLLNRVDADGMTAPDSLLRPARLIWYRARRLWNTLHQR